MGRRLSEGLIERCSVAAYVISTAAPESDGTLAHIEKLFVEGFREPKHGLLALDPSRPGLGLEFREADARRYAL